MIQLIRKATGEVVDVDGMFLMFDKGKILIFETSRDIEDYKPTDQYEIMPKRCEECGWLKEIHAGKLAKTHTRSRSEIEERIADINNGKFIPEGDIEEIGGWLDCLHWFLKQ